MRLRINVGIIALLTCLLLVGCSKSEKKEAVESKEDLTTDLAEEKQINIPIKERDFVTIKAAVLNIRQQPSKDSKVLGKTVQGQDFTVEKVVEDAEGQKWYAVNYKNDIGYLASWYCTRNKSQSIDLLGYAGYTILDAKWLDKDVIVLLKHQDKNHYKYLKYNVATTKTVEFYSDDKKVWNFWDAKNLENNQFAVCLSDRVLVFDADTQGLTKEVLIQGTDNNEGLYTEYNLLYDGSILYITDHEIRKKDINNQEDVSIYKVETADNRENILMAPRWSEYGTKISSYVMKNQSEQVLLIMDKQGQGMKNIPLENTMTDWLDDKYLFGYNNSNEEETGYIINSVTGKIRKLNLSKYIDDMKGATHVQNSSLMALYNTDDIYIIKDMVQIDLLKYTLPNEPGNDNLYFNQIGHKVICMQVKNHTLILYHLELYE